VALWTAKRLVWVERRAGAVYLAGTAGLVSVVWVLALMASFLFLFHILISPKSWHSIISPKGAGDSKMGRTNLSKPLPLIFDINILLAPLRPDDLGYLRIR
jgi:hypothetical protein